MMPPLREVPTLQELTIRRLGYQMAEMVPAVSQRIEESEKAGAIDTSLLRRLRLMHEHVSSHIISYQRRDVALAILNALSEVLERPDVCLPYPKILKEMVLVHNITTLDFTKWPQIIKVLLSNILPDLKLVSYVNISYFTNHSDSNSLTHSQVMSIIDSLSQMTELTSLAFSFAANDLLVETVIRNCEKLSRLSVSHSLRVTDCIIPFLSSCNHLTELYIGHTSITIPSYAVLVSKLPQLTTLDMGKCDDYDLVFRHFGRIGPFPNLEKLLVSDLDTNTLAMLVGVFPNISRIVLGSFQGDLTVLQRLRNLTDLRMLACVCDDSLKTFLILKGRDIRVIVWKNVDIGMEVWENLSTFCPNLRELEYYKCTFSWVTLPTLYFIHGIKLVPRFFHLYKLKWMAEDKVVLILLLKLTINIRFLYIGDEAALRAVNIYHVFQYNPMKMLEVFVIENCKHLTMEIVYFLVNRCERIKIIAELRSWIKIRNYELEIFKQYVKMNNYDLEITCHNQIN